jgi:hypothetical protein
VPCPSWTCASSRTLKENYLTVDGEDVLARGARAPHHHLEHDRRRPNVRHLGPVAEDFYRAFGLGLGETTIGLATSTA